MKGKKDVKSVGDLVNDAVVDYPSFKEIEASRKRYVDRKTINHHVITPAQGQKTAKYWEYVFSEQSGRDDIKRWTPGCQVDYKSAKTKLVEIANKKLSKGRTPKKLTFASSEEAKAWEDALRWFIYDAASYYDPKYDLLIYGNTGRGKTFLVECLIELGKHIAAHVGRLDKKFFIWNFADMLDLYEECVEAESVSKSHRTHKGNWVFDELGKEDRILQIYKVRYNFFERILTLREREKRVQRGIYISNLTDEGIKEHYRSSRFDSRWRGLVRGGILLEGLDRR